MTTEMKRLRSVCAEAYQLAGAVGAPVKVLDNLADAARGLPPRHETFLPILDTDCVVVREKDVRIAELEAELHIANKLLADGAQFHDRMLGKKDAEIERLKACLEPGKASAIVDAVFELARQRCGYTGVEAYHPMLSIERTLDRLELESERLRAALSVARQTIVANRTNMLRRGTGFTFCAGCGERTLDCGPDSMFEGAANPCMIQHPPECPQRQQWDAMSAIDVALGGKE